MFKVAADLQQPLIGARVFRCGLADARARAVAAQASITGPSFLYASTNKEVEELNRAEQLRRRADFAARGELIQAHGFQTVRGEVSIAAGERVQFYETDRKLGVATSEFGTVAAVHDNPYAWDMRAAYVIGTRHKEDYQLFVPRELAPDLTALTGQVMRQREDKGSSLRFEAAEAYDMRHRLGGKLFSQKGLGSGYV